MDPHLRGQQIDAFDGRERLFSGQRGRGGVLRTSQAGVLPQEKLRGCIDMPNDYMVWYRDRRIKTEYGTGIMDRRRKLGLVA